MTYGANPPKFKIIYEDEIKKITWDGNSFPCTQVLTAYHQNMPARVGLLVTGVKTRTLQKSSTGRLRGTLYLKADTGAGEWEITMPDCRINQIEPGIIWFHHDRCASVNILTKTSKRRR